MREIEDNSPPGFIVSVKANQHQVTQAVRKLYAAHAARVSTLTGPDGEKKAYVPLAPKLGSPQLSPAG